MIRSVCLVAAMALVLVACGEGDADIVFDAVATSTSQAPTTTVVVEVEQSAPAAVDVAGARELTDATTNEPTTAGWLLPSGVWTTDAFGHAFTFQTPIDLELRDVSPGLLRLADRDVAGGGSKAFISILTPTAVVIPPPTAAVAVAFEPVPLDFGSWLAGSDFTILDSNEVLAASGTLVWWDIEVTPGGLDPYTCELGDECHGLLRAGDDEIINAGGSSFLDNRVYMLEADDGRRVFAVVSGLRSIAGDMISAVEVALASATFEAPEPYPVSDTAFLRSLVDIDGIPKGSYMSKSGQTVMRFTVPSSLSELSVSTVSTDSSVISSDAVRVELTTPTGLIRPGAPQQAGFPSPELTLPLVDDVSGWISTMFAIEEQGTTTINGYEALWWDVSVDIDGPTFQCAAPDGQLGNCLNVIANGSGTAIVADWSNTRLFHLTGPGVLIVATSIGPIDEGLQSISSILDNVEFTPPAN